MPYQNSTPTVRTQHADSYERARLAILAEIRKFTALRDAADPLGVIAFRKEIDKQNLLLAENAQKITAAREIEQAK